MKNKVIILGKNFLTSLGVIRSLGSVGYPLELIYITGEKGASAIPGSSCYLSDTVEINERDDEKIIRCLKDKYRSTTDKYVLFPTDDYTTSLIDRYNEELREYFLMPKVENEENGAITYLMNKSVQIALAEQVGLRTASTWEISLDQDTIEIPQDITFPCFCKPQISARGYKSEIHKCESKNELEQLLHALQASRRDRLVIVQEYLNIKAEYSISGICNDQEIYLPAVLKKIKVAQHNQGVTLCGEILDFSCLPGFKGSVVALLQLLHYTGMIDIELLETERGIYFNEINFRCNGVGYALMFVGVNLPQKFVETVTQGSSVLSNDVAIDSQIKFVNDKVLWEDYQYNFLTKQQFNELSENADYSLLKADHDDPNPEKLFAREMKRKIRRYRIKQRIKRVIGR